MTMIVLLKFILISDDEFVLYSAGHLTVDDEVALLLSDWIERIHTSGSSHHIVAVVTALKYSHITPILKYLHCLN